jgi:hypothetical protein
MRSYVNILKDWQINDGRIWGNKHGKAMSISSQVVLSVFTNSHIFSYLGKSGISG